MTYDFKAESEKIADSLLGWKIGEVNVGTVGKRIEHSLREAAAAAYQDIESHFDGDPRRCSCEREACGFCEMLGWLRVKAAVIRGKDGNTKGQ